MSAHNTGSTQLLVLRQALEVLEHVSDPEPPWTDILGTARTLVGADSCTLVVFDQTGYLGGLQHVGVDDSTARDYNEHFHAEDFVAQASAGGPPGQWLDSQDLLPRSALEKKSYYADFMRKHCLGQICAYVIKDPATGQRAGFGFQREKPITNAVKRLECEAIAAYTGALGRALGRRRELGTQWLCSVETLFDSMSEAICVATSRGTVLALSNLAKDLLACSPALRIRSGQLWHPQPSVNEVLLRALAKASSSAQTVKVTLPVALGEYHQVEIARADPRLRLSTEQTLFLRLRTQRLAQTIDVAALRTAYGITPAEARVLSGLANGSSPAEIASDNGVSEQTVRKQIAALMSKTACGRQTDLVRIARLFITN